MKKKITQLVVVLVMVSFLLPVLTDLTLAAGNTYIVQPGDSLWKIASKFNTSVSTLRQLNNLWTNNLRVGQQILVPGQNYYYTVVSGDSFWKISRKTGVSVTAIKNANNLTSNYLRVGQRLIIPGTGGSSNPYPTTPSVSMSDKEVDLLARLIHAEAAGEPYSGKVAVAAVIINRIQSSLFPNTLNGVVYQKFAFESVQTGHIWANSPTSSEYQAAREALNGADPSRGAYFFYNPAKVANPYNWIFSRPITVRIGNHVFAK